eukprot:TRINITY_DN13075_c0_g1_i1.p1 TRINITY_DN13075_c0_g1~~TRINITY_DN13075_c0_g1_i1.p1  ORF type:complete len:492 (-),score=72.51 TRINITY_DN13075_c0_g1_i1:21-1496(-)
MLASTLPYHASLSEDGRFEEVLSGTLPGAENQLSQRVVDRHGTLPGAENQLSEAVVYRHGALAGAENQLCEPAVDRHDAFSSVVRLASERFEITHAPAVSSMLKDSWPYAMRQLSAQQEDTVSSLPSTAPWSALPAVRAPHSARSSRGPRSARSAMSAMSARSSRRSLISPRSVQSAPTGTGGMSEMSMYSSTRRKSGVAIWPGRLPRQDAIPVRVTGRRTLAAPDERIRIFVRVPKGRLAFWVPPDIPVGPAAHAETEIKDDTGRLTPFRALLTKKGNGLYMEGAEGIGASTAVLSDVTSLPQMSPIGSTAKLEQASHVESSLKDLVEAVTGIPAQEQKLAGPYGPLDKPSKILCDLDIGHGALLFLSLRKDYKSRSLERRHRKHGSSPRKQNAYADILQSVKIFDKARKFMKREIGSKMGKEFVEVLPDWQRAGESELVVEWPGEQQWFDYTGLPDNNIFDVVGTIRKRFTELPRISAAAAAVKQTQKG